MIDIPRSLPISTAPRLSRLLPPEIAANNSILLAEMHDTAKMRVDTGINSVQYII